MEYDNPQFVAAVKKILERFLNEAKQNNPPVDPAPSTSINQPLPVPTSNTFDISDTTIHKIKAPTQQEASHEWWKDFLEVAVAGMLLLYTIFSGFQWVEFNTQNRNQSAANDGSGTTADRSLHQVQESIRQTKDLVDVAKRQAKTAEKSSRNAEIALRESIRASKLDERAWFGIYDFMVTQYDPKDPRIPFRMQIAFKNTGKTPARQIHIYGIFGIHNNVQDGPSEADWKSFLSYYAKDTPRYVAAPNATRTLIFGGDTSDPMDDPFRLMFAANSPLIANGSKFLVFFGEANYIDNDNRSRTTKFCVVLGDASRKQLGYCGNGNDMD